MRPVTGTDPGEGHFNCFEMIFPDLFPEQDGPDSRFHAIFKKEDETQVSGGFTVLLCFFLRSRRIVYLGDIAGFEDKQ